MSSSFQVGTRMTLEEFLRIPEQKPVLEFIDGQIESKVSPQKKHSLITTRLAQHLNQFAEARGLGMAFVELRCTFAGQSLIPEVAFLRQSHIESDEHGEVANETLMAPDIHIEILSPEQSIRKAREKLHFSTANGCPLGVLIDPEKKTIDVFQPEQAPIRLTPKGEITGEPVLPGFRLPSSELFGWLKVRSTSQPGAPPASRADPA